MVCELTMGEMVARRPAASMMMFLAFFPVVASNTNLSTSIRGQKYIIISPYIRSAMLFFITG